MKQAALLTTGRGVTVLIAVLLWHSVHGSRTSWAAMMTVDEVLYEDDVVSPGVLAGTVDMTISGSTLTVVLTNTTTADAGDGGAGNILTGLGFSLPAGVTAGSGSVSMAGSVAIGFTAPGDDNVSSEWGYNNGVPTMGHFDPLPGGDGPATLRVNTVLSVLASDGPNQFAPGSIGGSPGLNGPDFGTASPNATVGGQVAIEDRVTFTLSLDGTVPADIISQIDANPVSIAFGSPKLSTIPEPTTAFLMAAGIAGLLACRRGR